VSSEHRQQTDLYDGVQLVSKTGHVGLITDETVNHLVPARLLDRLHRHKVALESRQLVPQRRVLLHQITNL